MLSIIALVAVIALAVSVLLLTRRVAKLEEAIVSAFDEAA